MFSFKIPHLCVPGATGQRFNPKVKLGLLGRVLTPNQDCTYTYAWKVYAYDYQYCESYDCWRYLQYMRQNIEGTFEFQTLFWHDNTANFQLSRKQILLNTLVSKALVKLKSKFYNNSCIKYFCLSFNLENFHQEMLAFR